MTGEKFTLMQYSVSAVLGLIDGQQRVTALMAAIAGKEILDDDFNKERIKIAFNPLVEDETKRFAVQDASHLKDKRWIRLCISSEEENWQIWSVCFQDGISLRRNLGKIS